MAAMTGVKLEGGIVPIDSVRRCTEGLESLDICAGTVATIVDSLLFLANCMIDNVYVNPVIIGRRTRDGVYQLV